MAGRVRRALRLAGGGGNSQPAAAAPVLPSSSSSAAAARKRDTVAQAARQRAREARALAGGTRPARASASAASGTLRRRPGSLVCLEIEHWHQPSRRWTDRALLCVTKKHVFIDSPLLNGADDAADGSVVQIDLGPALRAEHAQPLCTDFHLELVVALKAEKAKAAEGDTVVRHRIAFFSEDDGKDCLAVLAKHGAQIIILRRPLPLPPPDRSQGKRGSLPASFRQQQQPIGDAPPFLRPISETEPLLLTRHDSLLRHRVVPASPKMRAVETKILRRKSTGSEVSVDVRRKYVMGGPRAAAPPSPLGRSASYLGPKEAAAASRTVWYRGAFDDDATARALRKQKKQKQSDQSLDSAEVSSSSSSSSSSGTDSSSSGTASSHTSEESDGSSTCVYDSDEDLPDGAGPSALAPEPEPYRRRFIPRRTSGARLSDPTPPNWPGTGRADNEKLEKFKFLLVNIEEDEDLLEPGAFGLLGDYAACRFDDYPDAVRWMGEPDDADGATSTASYRKDSLSSSSSRPSNTLQWIRQSFQQQQLDAEQLEQLEQLSQLSQLSPPTSTSSYSSSAQLPRPESVSKSAPDNLNSIDEWSSVRRSLRRLRSAEVDDAMSSSRSASLGRDTTVRSAVLLRDFSSSYDGDSASSSLSLPSAVQGQGLDGGDRRRHYDAEFAKILGATLADEGSEV